jgi:hypothetical protein
MNCKREGIVGRVCKVAEEASVPVILLPGCGATGEADLYPLRLERVNQATKPESSIASHINPRSMTH